MPWRTVLEEGAERTEVFEIARRGSLVRIALQQNGEWTPVTMTWCPGLKASDFLVAPAPEADTATPATASAEEPATDDDVPALLDLALGFIKLQVDVLKAFRAKMGCGTGRLGFLDNAPQVGGFTTPGRGDWVWRIDPTSVSLTSRKQILEFPLPSHSQDSAFTSEALTLYLRGLGHAAVRCDGGVHPVDATTIAQQLDRLAQLGKLREFSRVPVPLYLMP